MRFEGTIKSWNDERGFGFIEPAKGGQEVFVHIKAFPRSFGRPQVNQRISFEVEFGPQGKKRARNVEPALQVRPGVRARHDSPAQWGVATLFAIPAFLVLYLLVSVLWRPPHWFAAAYLGFSLLTFLAYALDKASAVDGSRRVAERTLHTLALAGGWPGALLAQQFLRHKSIKAGFRSVFWGTVAVNVLVFLVLCSPAASPLWSGR